MWKYRLIVSYVGTDFCGWQKQKKPSGLKPSIQETFEDALFRVTGERPSVVASGRTDAGVHAAGQVVHFVLEKKEVEPWKIQRGINGLLAPQVQIFEATRVTMPFHAQRSATRKQYSYYFQQGPSLIPHLAPLSYWIRKELDVQAMAKALEALVGRQDFKPFQGAGSKPGSTVREIYEAEISILPILFPGGQVSAPHFLENYSSFSLVRVRVIGSGFLKQMVRGIAGTLLQVGEGKRPSSCMKEIIMAGDRSLVGPTAPARGLWLEKVWYPSETG